MTSTVRTPRLGVALVGGLVFVGLATTSGQAAEAAKKGVTFAKDVAPIFQRKCQVCHHPETVAPMSLMTYEETRPWARSIRKRVAAREMPPWHIDTSVGIQKFKNDRSLSDDEIATIVNWVDSGAPLGNPKDLPPPLQFADEGQWFIGKPDLVVSMPQDHIVPAHGPDLFPNYEAPLPLTEDRYVKAIQVRVTKDGRRVVHHAGVNLIRNEGKPSYRPVREPLQIGDSEARGSTDPVLNPGEETHLAEYALGKTGEIFPDGTGRVLKAGSSLRFSMHLHSVGEEIRARTTAGFVLYPKGYVPKHNISDLTIREMDRVDIPPNSIARSDVYYRLPHPARVVSFQPHMHIRGKAMCMEAIHLSGRREMLTCVDRYDFNWHTMYFYEDDVAPLLPAGTFLHLIGIQDNTRGNPDNPDPRLWVGWGNRSYDEMTAAHIDFEFLTEEAFRKQVEERQAQQQSLNKSQ